MANVMLVQHEIVALDTPCFLGTCHGDADTFHLRSRYAFAPPSDDVVSARNRITDALRV